MKNLISFNKFIKIILTFLFIINSVSAEKRLCGDIKCETILSQGITTSNYNAPSPGLLSFRINTNVRIISKPAESGKNDLWEVEIQGRRGLVPKLFIKEMDMYVKKDAVVQVEFQGVNNNLLPGDEDNSKKNQPELKSSEVLTQDFTTTTPLQADEVPKDIIKDTNATSNPEDSVQSTVVLKAVVDGTITPNEPQANRNDNAEDDVSVEIDDEDEDDDNENIDDDDEDDYEEDSYEIVTDGDQLNVDRNKILDAEIEKIKETSVETDLKKSDSQEQNNNVEKAKTDSKNEKEKTSDNNEEKTETVTSENSQKTDNIFENNKDAKKQDHSNQADSQNMEQNNEINSVEETKHQNVDAKIIDLTNNSNENIPNMVNEIAKDHNNNLQEEAVKEKQNSDDSNIHNQNEENINNSILEKTADDINEINGQNHAVLPESNDSNKATENAESMNVAPTVEDLNIITNAVENETNHINLNESSTQNVNIEIKDAEVVQDFKVDIALQNNQESNVNSFQQNLPTLTDNLQEQFNHNPEVKMETNHNEGVATTPGYEENTFMDNPVEVTTNNPVVEQKNDPIIEETLILNELKNENNNLDEHNYNNQQETDVGNNKIEIEPIPPLPLTQNTVQEESDSMNAETPTDNKMPTFLESFNTWTGIAFDTLNSFWNRYTEKEDAINVVFEQPVLPKIQEHENIKSHDLQYGKVFEEQYCEKIGPNDNCPKTVGEGIYRLPLSTSFTESDFFTSMSDKILEMFDMLVLLSIAAISSVFFAFGYYCICNNRKENFLINKLNIVERSLLAANKEVSILKQDLNDSRIKLTSIEDSSLRTKDLPHLVVNLEKKLNEKQQEKELLKEQITTLELDLENAASAGIELNKIISDLINKQKEHEIIADSVEKLKTELSEQQDKIEEINQKLSEKTVQNSDLHIQLSEQSAKFESEIEELQNKIDNLEDQKLLIQSKFDESEKMKEELQEQINKKIEEMQKLENELQSIKTVYNDINRKWQTSESKIESLKDCMRNMDKESWADIDDLIESVDIKADNLLLEKENTTLKEQLEAEKDAKKLLEDHVKIITGEVATLKKEHNQAEKDKLEATTRLDVLSTYFKEKEAQLQKDLTVKEALWMKQQGETTSTVEKIRTLQDEVQALKSQNESLHAEIEAQSVALKAQLATLENRNHETWLLSKQSERKYEEARSEATMLRRKLTALVSSGNANGNQSGGSNNTSTSNDINRLQNSIVDGIGSANINNVPSPIHLDSPSSPALIPPGLPPPPPFLPPPPFMPPLPGPFMGMPAPFALPPGGRPPPLGGRLMSPPPVSHRRGGAGRYSPSLIDDDYDDYDDYDYDDDRSQRRGGGRNNRNYSPENGRYSPDSRYNYTTDVMSQYDTETDFSPQVSPREESFLRGRRGGSINRDIRNNDRSTPLERTNSSNSKSGFNTLSPSPQKNNSNSTDNRSNKSSKGSSSYSYSPTSSSSSSSSSSLNDAW